MGVTSQQGSLDQRYNETVSSRKILLEKHYENHLFLLLDEHLIIKECNPFSKNFFQKFKQNPEGQMLWDLFSVFPNPIKLAHEKLTLVQHSPLVGEVQQLSSQLGLTWNLMPYYIGDSCFLFTAELYYVDRDDKLTQKLISQKEQAETANQTKLDFLANMSHELRNSLNGILGMTQILSLKKLPEESQDHVKDIHQSGQHLLTLVSDMLDFIKLEAGQLAINMEPFDLRKQISEIINHLAKQCEQKKLDIFLDYNDAIPRFLIGDGHRLHQIILNLVSNAIKFTPSGHILIAVESLQQNQDNALLQIIIEDTGIGIPQNKINQIFNRYTQAQNQDHQTIKKGVGLGLAIVKQLVERMGGEIGINSQVDHGATFWINLPFRLHKQDSHEQRWKENYPDLSILVIDDNLKRGKILLKQILGNRNKAIKSKYATEILMDTSETTSHYDIVLIDDQINTPGGPEALVKDIEESYSLDNSMLCLLSQPSNILEDNASNLFFHQIKKPLNPAVFSKDLADTWKRWTTELDVKTTHKKIKSQKINILLVEDNPMNQKVAEIMFSELGCNVTLAENGAETIAALPQKFDIIFLDIGLPDTDGCTLAQYIINNQNSNQETPLIALTAHVLDSDKEKFLAAGMRDVVTKPITFNSAKEALLKWAPQHDN